MFEDLVAGLHIDPSFQPKVGRYLRGRWRATGDDVIVKPGLEPDEVAWHVALTTAAPDLVPRIFAAGPDWTIEERIGWTLSPVYADHARTLVETGIDFHLAAVSVSLDPRPVPTLADVTAIVERAIVAGAPGECRRLMGRAEEDWRHVCEAFEIVTCHGDLHPGNVLCKEPPPGPVARGLVIGCSARRLPWPNECSWPTVTHAMNTMTAPSDALMRLMASARRHRGLPVPGDHEMAGLLQTILAWGVLDLWGRRETPERRAEPARRAMVARVVAEAMR